MTTAGDSFARCRERSLFQYALHFTIKVRYCCVPGCVQESAGWRQGGGLMKNSRRVNRS